MDPFEHAGMWWLPGEPDNQVCGILKFHPTEGAYLDLVGSLRESRDWGAAPDTEIVLGLTSEGNLMTLYDCIETEYMESIGGPARKSSYAVNLILEGHHFTSKDAVMFDTVWIRFSHFAEWARISGFKGATEFDQASHFTRYRLNFVFPERTEAEVQDLTISFDYTFTAPLVEVADEVSLKQTTFLKIQSAQPMHFNDYLSGICYSLQCLLSLGTGVAVYPIAFKANTTACRQVLRTGEIILNDVHAYYVMSQRSGTRKRIRPHDMLFSYRDISDNFQDILSNWYSMGETLGAVYDLYFNLLHNPSSCLENQFLSIMQALEAYHRKVRGGKYLLDEDYQPVRTSMESAIPSGLESDFAESLRNRLRYHNEFALRRRLKELLRAAPEPTRRYIGDTGRFIMDIVNTRNFLTHYDDTLKSKAKSGEPLYWLIQKTKYLLEMCLLSAMQMPEDKIRTIALNRESYKDLAHH